MRNLKRLTGLAALVLAGLALTAASASADIVDPVSGDPYVGEVAAVFPGVNIELEETTFQTSSAMITCDVAAMGGTIDGNAPATGELDFSWDDCRIVNGPDCTASDMINVAVVLSEWPPAPDFRIINEELFATAIECEGGVFACWVRADPNDGSEFTAYVTGGTNPVVIFDDTVVVSGLGCPNQALWEAQYEITVPEHGLESND